MSVNQGLFSNQIFLLLFCFAIPLLLQAEDKAAKAAPIFRPVPDEAPVEKAAPSDSESVTSPSVGTSPPPPAENIPGAQVISATVRVVRSNPQSEVFFMDRKESLIIPANAHHNEIFEACLASSRTRTPISFLANLKTRTILSIKAPGKDGTEKSR